MLYCLLSSEVSCKPEQLKIMKMSLQKAKTQTEENVFFTFCIKQNNDSVDEQY